MLSRTVVFDVGAGFALVDGAGLDFRGRAGLAAFFLLRLGVAAIAFKCHLTFEC